MDRLNYQLRVRAPFVSTRDSDLQYRQEEPFIVLKARFSTPDGQRGSVQRVVSQQALLDGLRAGVAVVEMERRLAEDQMHVLSGLQPVCTALELPPRWSTTRGPDDLVTALWPTGEGPAGSPV